MLADTAICPSRAEFLRLAQAHSLVPVYRTLTADLETPVSAFLRLASDEPQSFLLESVEGGEKVGRYTFIGVRPYRTILSRGKSIVIEERGKTRSLQGDVFALLKEMLAGQTPAHIPGLPPFTSGAVGFFAYDVVRQLERLPELAEDDLGVPDACLMFFDEVLAFDHVRKQIQLMVTADLSRLKPAAAYADAKARLVRLEKRLSRPLPRPRHAKPRGKLSVTSHTLKKDFLAAVDRIKEYIAAGDIFQAVLSQRFEVKPGVDPFPFTALYASSIPHRTCTSCVLAWRRARLLRLPAWWARLPNCWCECKGVMSSTVPSRERGLGQPTRKRISVSSRNCGPMRRNGPNM